MRSALPLLLGVVLFTSACSPPGSGKPDAGFGGFGGGVFAGGSGGSGGSGGGTSTGGGTATGGGSATGGSGGSGGGTGTSGIGTFARVGFGNQLLAPAPDGSMHLLFSEGAAERVVYGRCAANCSDAASWSLSQLLDHAELGSLTVSVAGLAVDGSGRVHALVHGVAMAGSGLSDPVVYATCASNCGDGANWAVVSLGDQVVNGAVGVVSGLVVSDTGAVSFVSRGAFGNYDARFATCASNCAAGVGSWTVGPIVNGTITHLAVDAAGVFHIAFTAGTTGNGERLHSYGRCASNCTQAASWQLSAQGFVHSTFAPPGFVVTPSGRVYLSFNQGMTTIGAENNGTLFLNSCAAANCAELSNWTSAVLGTDDREVEAWLARDGESLGLISTSTTEVRVRTCDANCASGAGWSAPVVVDEFMAIAQSIPPATGSSCPATATSAFWYPAYPRGAASATGVIIAHAPYALVNCPGSTSSQRSAPIGRVYSTF